MTSYLGMSVPLTQSLATMPPSSSTWISVHEAIRMDWLSMPLFHTMSSSSSSVMTASWQVAERILSPERKTTLLGWEVTAGPQRRSQCQGHDNY